MIRWLKRLFGRPERGDVFRYFDGTRFVCADPIQDPELLMDQHFADLQSEDPTELMEAQQVSVSAARRVFHIDPLAADGESGLTDAQVLGVLSDYLTLCAALKKNGSLSPILLRATTRRSSPSPSLPITAGEKPLSACS